MTRKRKIIPENEANSWRGNRTASDSRRYFAVNDNSGIRNNRNSGDFMWDFEERYGYVKHPEKKWKRNRTDQQFVSSTADSYEPNGPSASTGEYPSELVEYMKHIAGTLKDSPSGSADDLRRKCAEECKGYEVDLCMYDTSCRLIEEIFGDCHDAANQWMSKITDSGPETQLQLLCMPSACRTLETLLSALTDSRDSSVLLGRWVDLIVKNWFELVVDRNASHFIRSLACHLVGMRWKKSGEKEKLPVKDTKNRTKKLEIAQIDPATKANYERIASLALNYNSVKDYLNDESVSLVLQDIAECDSVVRGGCIQLFVETGCMDASAVRNQWKGKQSSRLWEILVQKIDEDLRQKLYNSVLEGKLLELSLHKFSNFPVQSYIASAKSDELRTDIFDELIEHFEDICASGKWKVITALIQITAHSANEIVVLKKLRNYFKCASKSARLAFIPNVFTLDGSTSSQSGTTGAFDVSRGKLHGSLLLQELLLKFEHNKTVITSLKSLTDSTVLEIARDQKGSFVLQALFRSPLVSQVDKEWIAKPLKRKWREILNGNVSSHVFDAMWETSVYSIKEKEQLMDNLSRISAEDRSKTMRLMCVKMNLRGFKEQRKKWLKDNGGMKSAK